MSGLNLNSPPNAIVKILKTYVTGKHFRSSFATDADNKEIYISIEDKCRRDAHKDFIADNEFVTVTSDYGFMEGSKGGPFANEIANTVDDPVYQTEINGLAKYILRIPNGKAQNKTSIRGKLLQHSW